MQLLDVDLQQIFPYREIFNPSITWNEDGTFLLICRLQNNSSEGYLGLCILDANFRPLKSIAVIRDSPLMKGVAKIMLEDPRTFVHKGEIYLSHVESSPSFLYFCYTVFSRLGADGSLGNPVILDYKKNGRAFEAVKRLGHSEGEKTLPLNNWLVDKNWQFFIREDQYYCIYQAGEKHELFRFEYPAGTIRRKYITYGKIPWSYGRISGGASPVLHSDGYYYSFFHSWTEWKNPAAKQSWLQRKYHVGAYLFEENPPFRIKLISEYPLISGSESDTLAGSGHSAVFPGSALFDKGKNEWILAIGWNDHSCKIVRIPQEKLIADLLPVSPLSYMAILKKESGPALKKIRGMGGRIFRASGLKKIFRKK